MVTVPGRQRTRSRFPRCTAGFVLTLFVLVLLLVPSSVRGSDGVSSVGRPTPASPMAGCASGPLPANVSGVLRVEGGNGTIPSTANVSILVSYYLQITYVPRTGHSTSQCQSKAVSVVTNSSGGFSLVTSIPGVSCNSVACTYTAGPDGPRSFVPQAGDPAGYFDTFVANGSTVVVNFVRAYASASLSPPGPTTLAPNAPAEFVLSAWAADGTPARGTFEYRWSLNGTGWSILSGAGTSQLSISASLGAGAGTLTASLTDNYNGSIFTSGIFTAALSVLPTSITSASLRPTSLDVGSVVQLSLSGVGAAGFAYSTTFWPGLGANATVGSCTSVTASGGAVDVTCGLNYTYRSAGVAQPVVALGNGYSSATWNFPPITVAPGLQIVANPDPVEGYLGATATVHVEPAPGTGTAPFGPACLVASGNTTVCSSGPGVLALPLTANGNTSWLATLRDAAGDNASTVLQVRVGTPLMLSSIVPGPGNATVGVPLHLVAPVSGGLAPVEFWWNGTAAEGSVASGTVGPVDSLSIDFVPSVPGWQWVTLTVRDALGSQQARGITLDVAPGPASALIQAAELGNTVAAGSPLNVTWSAVDGARDRVLTYSNDVALAVNGSAAHGILVETSSGLTITPSANETYSVPASAWREGELTIFVTPVHTGLIGLRLEAPLPVVGGWPLPLTVSPDVLHLAVSNPWTAPTAAGADSTKWQIADRWGNPIPGGYVLVRTVAGGSVADHESPIEATSAASFVWVNYTWPSQGSATLYVFSEWGQALLPPLTLLPLTSLGPSTWLIVGAGAGAVTGLAGVVLYRSKRERRRRALTADVSEEELRRLAEGRDRLLDELRGGPAPLETLMDSCASPPTTREEILESLSALIAEGTVRELQSPDGIDRYALKEPQLPSAPRVTIDPEAFEAALELRPEREPHSDSAEN